MGSSETYKLIAFDMDGTLLSSSKSITDGTVHAIHRAVEAGKIVALCTGRSIPELQDYLKMIPDVAYGICASGALVYDFKNNEPVYKNCFSQEQIQGIHSVCYGENKGDEIDDIMLQLMSFQEAFVSEQQYQKIGSYNMDQYTSLFLTADQHVEHSQMESLLLDPMMSFVKINLFHTSLEARARSRSKIEKLHLGMELADSEISNLELTPAGTTKGVGLRRLCELLDVPVSQSIAVGDADNDTEALKTAGLAVAMGNAAQEIKALADVIVADNDHDGCAEAIDKFLLA